MNEELFKTLDQIKKDISSNDFICLDRWFDYLSGYWCEELHTFSNNVVIRRFNV